MKNEKIDILFFFFKKCTKNLYKYIGNCGNKSAINFLNYRDEKLETVLQIRKDTNTQYQETNRN